jgi:hypothetical protein
MSQLSPCPQCRSERVWARAALGAYGITHVAFCPGCARAATICTHCGTELVLVRHSNWSTATPRTETSLQCPTCRQGIGDAPGRGGSAGVAAWSAAAAQPATARRSLLGRFTSDAPTPAVMQRVADDSEQLAALRYVRHRQLLGVLDEAARRADAMARLEIELQRRDPAA